MAWSEGSRSPGDTIAHAGLALDATVAERLAVFPGDKSVKIKNTAPDLLFQPADIPWFVVDLACFDENVQITLENDLNAGSLQCCGSEKFDHLFKSVDAGFFPALVSADNFGDGLCIIDAALAVDMHFVDSLPDICGLHIGEIPHAVDGCLLDGFFLGGGLYLDSASSLRRLSGRRTMHLRQPGLFRIVYVVVAFPAEFFYHIHACPSKIAAICFPQA